MKRTLESITAAAIVVTAFLYTLTARADNSPAIIEYPLEKAYVPVGFDDNDKVQIVVAGVFPDTCHKVGPVAAEMTPTGLRVRQLAYRYRKMCMDVMVPFSAVVEVGLVRDGSHAIFDGKSGKDLGSLSVTRAKGPEADDHLYAPVTDAQVVEAAGGQATVSVTGTFPSPSMRMKEVRVQPHGDVIVVLPIAEVVTGEVCPTAPRRFDVKVQVPQALAKGTYLLHVRSMNGQAVNKLVDIAP